MKEQNPYKFTFHGGHVTILHGHLRCSPWLPSRSRVFVQPQFGARRIDAINLGLMGAIRPTSMTDRPAIERRMDPLSEVFGSLGIQDAIYTRLEATAPW